MIYGAVLILGVVIEVWWMNRDVLPWPHIDWRCDP